jgi:Calcineurin-like phosphoesterase
MPDSQSPSCGKSEEFLVRSAVARCAYWTRVWIVIAVLAVVLIGLTAWWRAGRHEGTAIVAKYVWIQMLPDAHGQPGGRLVRAIVTQGGGCPTIVEDRKPVQMSIRSAPARAAFPVVLCQAELAAASDAWIGTRPLPARPSDPHDVIVIGDTGCRMVYYEPPQGCTSGLDWPFAAVASSAASVAAKSSSIIMHVGDFHYRENPCAEDSPACGGSPYGDNWATWEAEFFKPAAPLLLAAPWVILRGNHENCARAGAGWQYFFALPTQADQEDKAACRNDLSSYRLSLGMTQDRRPRVLIVLETADERNSHGLAARCRTYEKWMDEITWSDAEFWLALHQPLWLRNARNSTKDKQWDGPVPLDPCDQAKSALDGIRARFDKLADQRTARLVLSGDTHLFEFFRPEKSTRPIQLVAGDGGTKLDRLEPPDTAATSGASQDQTTSEMNKPVKSYGVDGVSSAIVQFGFVRMHLDRSIWTVDLIGLAGKTLVLCGFSESPASDPPADHDPSCREAASQ